MNKNTKAEIVVNRQFVSTTLIGIPAWDVESLSDADIVKLVRENVVKAKYKEALYLCGTEGRFLIMQGGEENAQHTIDLLKSFAGWNDTIDNFIAEIPGMLKGRYTEWSGTL